MSFPIIVCCCIAVEVKKEPEPPTETVKQEEREPATKSSAPAPPSKPPPEKRARLQWQLQHSYSVEDAAMQRHVQEVQDSRLTLLSHKVTKWKSVQDWEFSCSSCKTDCHSAHLLSLQDENELAHKVSCWPQSQDYFYTVTLALHTW